MRLKTKTKAFEVLLTETELEVILQALKGDIGHRRLEDETRYELESLIKTIKGILE